MHGMDRLSAVDASFLRVESPTAHMHVGWRSVVDRPPGMARLDAAALRARIAARLDLVPRFRQRIVGVPLGMTEPVWADDPEFDVDRHVHELRDDGELDGRDLRAVADAFLSRPLDRSQPLWEILVVPRMVCGRAAILGKVHHAMVDGIAAVQLGMLLFDLEPDAASPDAPPPWAPAPAATGVRLAVDALADTAVEQLRQVRRVAALGRSPGRSLRIADSMRRAALSLAEDALRPAPESYLNAPIGPRRTLSTHAVELERLLAIKRACGVSLNDVVLAVCGGALGRFAEVCDEPPADLRVMVPVSVRDGQEGTGNRITFGFVDLPVLAPSPRKRLALVTRNMAELKASGRIGGSALLMQGLGALPEPVKDRAARLAASPRLYNVTISNVPGPGLPLYAAGARVRSIAPVIPLADRHALSIGVLTYDGRAHFSVYADPDVLPRAHWFAGLLADAVAELELAVEARGRRPRTPGRARLRGDEARAARAVALSGGA
jgi:diacylglycerol O-acyltransferase